MTSLYFPDSSSHLFIKFHVVIFFHVSRDEENGEVDQSFGTNGIATFFIEGVVSQEMTQMKRLLFTGLSLLLLFSGCGGGGGEGSGTSTVANTQEATSYYVRASTLDEETERVWYYLEHYKWYLDNNYNISFPDHPLIADLIDKSLNGALKRDSDYPELQAAMTSIYDENDYVAGLKVLNECMPGILACASRFLEYKSVWASHGWNFKTFDDYTVLLTLYGTGGSYNPTTGTITMHTHPNGTFHKNPVSIAIHESVHIAIDEEVVVKCGLAQGVKERIVDRFCFDHFGYSMQANGDDSIDSYLNFRDSWERLPYYVGQYVSELRIIQD